MSLTFHILNGDALKERFPNDIKGEQIVARKCLVDGPVDGENLKEFYQKRAQFIRESYGDYSIQKYFRDTVSQFEKIQNIPAESEVNLWFEDDLFCQVNLWFVGSLIYCFTPSVTALIVRPPRHTPYGFGELNSDQLGEALSKRIQIKEIKVFHQLWEAYRLGNIDRLKALAEKVRNVYPFILPAVEAHIERIPSIDNPGRPKKSLISIMDELRTKEFGPVFQEFCKRESIYGFGDLQVKRLYDELLNS